MNISSDWIVYYLRSYGLCEGVHNIKIGIAVKNAFDSMGCKQNPMGEQVLAPPPKRSETALATDGRRYDIALADLPEFFKKLSEALEVELN